MTVANLTPTHISHHGEIDDKAKDTAEGHGDLPLETEVVGSREEIQEPGDEALHTYKLWPGQLRQVPHVPVHFLPNNAKPPDHQPLPHSCPRAPANLAVQTEQQQHEEEQGSPEWGHRHQCDSPWVGNEG